MEHFYLFLSPPLDFSLPLSYKFYGSTHPQFLLPHSKTVVLSLYAKFIFILITASLVINVRGYKFLLEMSHVMEFWPASFFKR
jgi:hypothetical protein